MLPTSTALYRIEADGRKLEVSHVDTKWGSLSNGTFVPVALCVSKVSGNPTKPTTFSDYSVEFFWTTDRKFPAELFDPTANVGTVELRDAIVENAKAIAPLRLAN